MIQQKIDLKNTSWQEGDDFTVEEGLQKATFNSWAQDLVRLGCRAMVGRESREVSMHYFLDYVKSGGGFMDLISEGEFGAQSLKIKQGKSLPFRGPGLTDAS